MFAVQLLLGNHKIFMTAIYHPPTPSIALNYAFIEALEHHMRRLIQFSLPIIVAGDLNVNSLNHNNFVYVGSLVNSMLELGLTPIITIPTKVNLANPITRFSITDYIWVSQHIVNQQSFVFPLGITDHFPVGTLLRFPLILFVMFKDADANLLMLEGRSHLIYCFQVSLFVLLLAILISLLIIFLQNVFICYDVAFPIVLRKTKQLPTAPWMTSRLRQCIKKKV